MWLFYNFAARHIAAIWISLIGALAFGLGTMVFPYALAFNHHVPAAAALFASFYLLTTPAAVKCDDLEECGMDSFRPVVDAFDFFVVARRASALARNAAAVANDARRESFSDFWFQVEYQFSLRFDWDVDA